MRWVELNAGGTLVADLPARPDAAGTFTVEQTGGAAAQAATAPTLDAVNTTLSGALAAGAGSCTVASAAGIAVGRRYLIAGREDAGGEQVTVKSISGTTVTLVRPVRRAQASGATFQSTRTSFAIAAATVASVGRNWRVKYPWIADGVTQETFFLPFDVTRYCPVSYLQVEDVREFDPQLAKRVPEGTWLPGLVARAWDMLLAHVAQKGDPGAFVGTIDLTTPHGYLVRFLLAELAGDDWKGYRDRMAARHREELDAALAAMAYDTKQDGVAQTGSGWARGMRLVRA